MIYQIIFYSDKRKYTFYNESVFDLVKDIGETECYTDIIDKHFRKPFIYKALSLNNNLLTNYMKIALYIFLGNKTELYIVLNKSTDKLELVYFLNNLIHIIKKSQSLNINLSFDYHNETYDISKIFTNTILLILDNEPKMKDILILLNMKVEISRLKKIIVDKISNRYLNYIKVKVHKFLNLKNDDELKLVYPENLTKVIFEHDNTYNSQFMNFLTNFEGTGNNLISQHLRIFKDAVVVINYLLKKHKHKKKLRSYLVNLQNDVNDSTASTALHSPLSAILPLELKSAAASSPRNSPRLKATSLARSCFGTEEEIRTTRRQCSLAPAITRNKLPDKRPDKRKDKRKTDRLTFISHMATAAMALRISPPPTIRRKYRAKLPGENQMQTHIAGEPAGASPCFFWNLARERHADIEKAGRSASAADAPDASAGESIRCVRLHARPFI